MARREQRIQSIKGENISFEGEISHFLIFLSVEREREIEEGSLWRFTGFRRTEFVGQRTKVHLLDEGYAKRFHRRSTGGDLGKLRALNLGSVLTYGFY